MRALTEMEMDEVNGGGWEHSTGALVLIGAISEATWGATWGATVVATAFAASPIAFVAVVGLAVYAGACLYW